MQTDNWYVLHVRTGRELPVAEAARMLEGVTAMVPIQSVFERQDGEFTEKRRLVFPGYVFVRTERLHAKRYYEFKRIDGVIRLLGLTAGDIPRSVPEEEMAELALMVDTDHDIGISHGVKTDGGKVEIIDGPLAGLKGRILKIDTRQKRATVRMSLMGQPQTVSLALIISSQTEPEAEQSPRAEDDDHID